MWNQAIVIRSDAVQDWLNMLVRSGNEHLGIRNVRWEKVVCENPYRGDFCHVFEAHGNASAETINETPGKLWSYELLEIVFGVYHDDLGVIVYSVDKLFQGFFVHILDDAIRETVYRKF